MTARQQHSQAIREQQEGMMNEPKQDAKTAAALTAKDCIDQIETIIDANTDVHSEYCMTYFTGDDYRDVAVKIYEKTCAALQADLAASQAEVARLRAIPEQAAVEFERRSSKYFTAWEEFDAKDQTFLAGRADAVAQTYDDAAAHLRALVSRDASVVGSWISDEVSVFRELLKDCLTKLELECADEDDDGLISRVRTALHGDQVNG